MQSPMRSTSFARFLFQYRKRYGLHAIIGHAPSNEHRSVSIPQAVWIACNVESDVSHPGWCGFNTASGMDCMQFSCGDAPLHEIGVSIPQAVWIACNFLFLKGSDQMNTVSIPQAVWIACNLDEWYPLLPTERVSIPQAVWIACNPGQPPHTGDPTTVSIPQAVWIACNGITEKIKARHRRFNTASGMDCMQYRSPRAKTRRKHRFNTASGMDCMQSKGGGSLVLQRVGFNTASGMDCMQ